VVRISQALPALRRRVVRLAPAAVLASYAARAEADDDWPRAERLYRRLAARRPSDPAVALRVARALDHRGKAKDAQAWVRTAFELGLEPGYDARAAFGVHPLQFTDRHDMAMFILANSAELDRRIAHNRKTAGHMGDNPKVWVYWDRPETMPDVVAAARASLRAQVREPFELVELDDSTVDAYADLSHSPLTRRLQGRPTHFSDYLRLLLLHRHGGLWLDATCYLTQDLWEGTEAVRREGLFLYRYAGSRVGSWFLWSEPDSLILNSILAVFELWWEREDRLTNYFMWHDIAEMLYWTRPDYREAWDAMTAVHPRAALAMLRHLEKPYDPEMFEQIARESYVHKLTYKFDPRALDADTFAAHIVSAN